MNFLFRYIRMVYEGGYTWLVAMYMICYDLIFVFYVLMNKSCLEIIFWGFFTIIDTMIKAIINHRNAHFCTYTYFVKEKRQKIIMFIWELDISYLESNWINNFTETLMWKIKIYIYSNDDILFSSEIDYISLVICLT